MKSNTERLNTILNDWDRLSEEQEKAEAPAALRIAEGILKKKKHDKDTADLLRKYLNVTYHHSFLSSLASREERYRWAETAFQAIEAANYGLDDLLAHRAGKHPSRTLFKTVEGGTPLEYSYSWVYRKIRQMGALFLTLDKDPKVAIFCDNSLESALCDLACLSFGVIDSPLNVHFSADQVAWTFGKLGINIAVTDTEERLQILLKVREKTGFDFQILYTGYHLSFPLSKHASLLEKLVSGISASETDRILSLRKERGLKQVATVMFTSGSTGEAKGVMFSMYNLITKRFARAAALPFVGDHEVLLCYLPLFHTFGRYLELLGSIYWGGTYVFAGNPSVETLISLMKKENPSGLISIPLRWTQIRDHYLELEKHFASDGKKPKGLFRNQISSRLNWGLSAAGYLDPKVFQFFHRHGVRLCSGFGMTEATGGISMTPPDEYVPNSVGIPLPGIETRINDIGELEIRGHYVASYLEGEDVFDGNMVIPADKWLSTGDLFKENSKGHLFIIDRIKDIYKNNKGQTIAPGKIEKIFANIPGFKRAFLAGDGKPYNTLLIVPDRDDPLFEKARRDEKIRDYFSEVISTANKELAPYERIVDFSLLERDFEETKGEVAAKGTFRRKNIEHNFAQEISRMYRYPNAEFAIDDMTVKVPRWLYRDLSLTAQDIEAAQDGLEIKDKKLFLIIKRNYRTGRVQIGDLEYIVDGSTIDLGLFVRQPLLWGGNAALINFAYCKDGWDVRCKGVSKQVFLSRPLSMGRQNIPSLRREPSDPLLREVNRLVIRTFYTAEKDAEDALRILERKMHTENHRLASLIRRRIETLALHPEFRMRSQAYRILLLDEPQLDYSRFLPAFISSGLPFLSKEDIEDISGFDIGHSRMTSFRLRLEAYRDLMSWPAKPATITQFKRILDLIVNFARHNRLFYGVVREELISWILHDQEPALSSYARKLFTSLAQWFESTFELTEFEKEPENWKQRMVFQEEIFPDEIQRLKDVLCCSTFLKESLMLIYEEDRFNLKDVLPSGGIWISKILSPRGSLLYRVSINTTAGKHFDLMLMLRSDINMQAVRETMFRIIKITGKPGSQPVLPRFGNFRSSMGAASMSYVSELTVWEKIREYSSRRDTGAIKRDDIRWKSLYVRAIAAFFKLWAYSDKKVLPGSISPANVVVPEADFRGNSYILSLSGWQNFNSLSSIIEPVINNFYLQVYAHYPRNKDIIKYEWIFDAAYEAFPMAEAGEFLSQIKDTLLHMKLKDLAEKLSSYCRRLEGEPYINLQVLLAVERYREWAQANAASTKSARLQFIKQLYGLYSIDTLPEIMRFVFYAGTYFSHSEDNVRQRLESLIKAMFLQPAAQTTKLIELSELQDSLQDTEDRQAFSSMVFPEYSRPLNIELVRFGDDEHREVFIKTHIADNLGNSYTVRKSVSPFEVGSLYRLFILDDYPATLMAEDQFLILTDEESEETVYGGVCYRITEHNSAFLEGLVVAEPYRGKRLGSALLDDLCSRLISQGITTITTHFYMTSFFRKNNFNTDSRWGGLVRFLE